MKNFRSCLSLRKLAVARSHILFHPLVRACSCTVHINSTKPALPLSNNVNYINNTPTPETLAIRREGMPHAVLRYETAALFATRLPGLCVFSEKSSMVHIDSCSREATANNESTPRWTRTNRKEIKTVRVL